jgi:GT2 family glycosyltransferase
VLVLVDDGSTDDTFQVVASYSFAKQIIRGDGSLWFAGGVRRGMARVLAQNPRQDDVVWFANDDTSFESNFLENALR